MEANQKSLELINTQRRAIKTQRPELFRRYMELEELYSEYNIMVYDIPKFDFDDPVLFHKIWKEHHVDCRRMRTDIASPYEVDSTPRFRCLDILDKNPTLERIWTTNLLDVSKEFPKFFQQMHDLLPFDDITYVRMWQSIGPIRMHRDDSFWYFNVPAELRIMMYNENDTDTFKVQPELVPNDLKYLTIPENANAFGWNNVRCLHGSDKFENKEKILACVTGIFNSRKLRDLYERSAPKFNNQKYKTVNDPYNDLLFK